MHYFFIPFIPYLRDLNQQACFANAGSKPSFLIKLKNDKRFTLLAKAYIESRYKLGYSINPPDLVWLAERVEV